MMLSRSTAALAAMVGLAIGAGCAAPAAAPAEGPAPAAADAAAPSPEMISQGRQVFASAGRCAVCHGQDARGGSLGPDLVDDEWIWVDPAANLQTQIAGIVRDGIEEPRVAEVPMPPMGGASLTDEQIQAVAAYLTSLHT